MDREEEMEVEMSNISLLDEVVDDVSMEEDISEVVFPQPTIRQIDVSKVVEKLSAINSIDDATPENICKSIIEHHNEVKAGYYKIFEPTIEISQCKVIRYSEERAYMSPAVQVLGRKQQNQVTSIVIFIITNKHSIFCLTIGSQAYRVIEIMSDTTFPSRALRYTATKEVSRFTRREFHGTVFARSLYFRSPLIPNRIQTNGLITAVHTRVGQNDFLDKHSFLKLSVGEAKVRGARLKTAISAVSICKTLKLGQIIEIVQDLDCNMDEGGSGCDILDYVDEVNETNTKEILEDLLMEQIYKDLRKTESELEEDLPFDFVYKDNLEKDCTNFRLGKVRRDEVSSYKDAIMLLKEYEEKEREKAKDLKSLTISFKLKEKDHTDPFLQFFQGERLHDEKVYCKINGQWLRFECNFRKQIKDACNVLIRNKFCDENDKAIHLEKKWGCEKESEYCLKYNDDNSTPPKFLVGDGVVVHDEIELFDILKITDNALYLYHVKKGFPSEIRTVCSQIRTSASIIQAARYSEADKDNCLIELHDQVVNNDLTGAKNESEEQHMKIRRNAFGAFSKEEFSSMFWGKKVVYVYAFKNSTKQGEKLLQKYIKENRVKKYPVSEIARHELMHTNMHLEELGFEFRICQIHAELPHQKGKRYDAGSTRKPMTELKLNTDLSIFQVSKKNALAR